jgi:hypothetical protein
LCLNSAILLSQDRAAIRGTVLDPTGAVVPGASIELKSAGTGLRRVTLSDDHGLYQIGALPVGSYALAISKAGFKPVSVDQIDLPYGKTRIIDPKLEVGDTSETVQVIAVTEILDRTTAEVGGVVESPQIQEIPAPANGQWGNLGRYVANGPGMYEIDSSLQKKFKLAERIALNFRAAAYNLFNNPVYKNPSASIGSLTGNPPSVSGSFGKITSIINTGAVGTGAPRRIEFMLRAEF